MDDLKIEGGSAQEILILFEPNLQYKHLPKGKVIIIIKLKKKY